MPVTGAILIDDFVVVTKFSDGNVYEIKNRSTGQAALCQFYGQLNTRGQSDRCMLAITIKQTDTVQQSLGGNPGNYSFASMLFRLKFHNTSYRFVADQVFVVGASGNLNVYILGESYVWRGPFQ